MEQQFARITDPATSQAAGQGAEEAISDSVKWVKRVMADGKPRIDEEIFAVAEAAGFSKSFDRIRHGRLVLVKKGVLVFTGRTKPTNRRRQSQEWMLPGGSGPSLVAKTSVAPVQTALPFDAPFTPHCPSCTCGKHKADE